MKRTKKYIKILIPVLVMAAFGFLFVKIAGAQTQDGTHNYVPEPSSIVLLLTGFMSWVVRAARKKFLQFKKAFDIVTSAIGIVVLTPIMALFALYIKVVSPGPALFKQERVGKDGRTFMIYKLRTMRLDAEEKSGPTWAKEDDPRLIRGGRAIRKMHVDEFPQLINVLKGEMSVVGPRPERPVFVDALSDEIRDYKKRLDVKPGITGLAQVWHKYDESIKDVRKKIKYDILYIKKMCFLTDIRILFRTIVVAATGKGAR